MLPLPYSEGGAFIISSSYLRAADRILPISKATLLFTMQVFT